MRRRQDTTRCVKRDSTFGFRIGTRAENRSEDDSKRVDYVAEELAFPRIVMHMGGSREAPIRGNEICVLQSLWNTGAATKHVVVTLCVDNTTSEWGNPEYLLRLWMKRG